MKIKGSVALVTGANRGLSAAFARDLAPVTLPGVVPMHLGAGA